MNKARITFFVLLFGFTSLRLEAQELSFSHTDSLNYQQFLAGKWGAVIKTGKEAILNGHDYYYLRMRMGIAAFEKENYVLARNYFNEAAHFNPNDPDAYKYLIACRLLRNQLSLAGAEAIGKPYYLQKKLFPKSSFQLQSAHVDVGYIQYKPNKSGFEKLAGTDGYYGTESAQQNRRFIDGGLKFQIHPGFFLYTGFQSLKIPFTDRFASVDFQLVTDSIGLQPWGKEFYYNLDSTQRIESFEREVSQDVLYAQIDWAPTKRLQFILSGQLILMEQQLNIGIFEPLILRDTAYTVYQTNETSFFDLEVEDLRVEKFNDKSTDWSFYAGMVFDAGYLSLSGGFTTSRINKQQIIQLSSGLSYFPFGNLNLYGSSEINLVHFEQTNNLIFEQTMGFRPLRFLWIEGFLHLGNQSFFSDQTAYIVYNTVEDMKIKTGIHAHIMLSKHLSIQLRCAFSQGERPIASLVTSTGDYQTNYTSYQSTIISGGIKWTR